MLLLVDNHDSFTYNLVQYFQILGIRVKVIRNDEMAIEGCKQLQPSYLVISPGPGNPSQAGISMDLIHTFAGKIPILGVCLGHQCIAESFGGHVIRATQPVHGKTSPVIHLNSGMFENLPQEFKVTRYHSLIVERKTLPDCLTVTAETFEGEIMGLRHKTLPIEGVQFHPESVMTEYGMDLLRNFFKMKI